MTLTDLTVSGTIQATPDDEMGRRHQEGWGFVLGALADRFASRGR